MGLLLKARTATITEATLQLKMGQKKENPIEMEQSMLPAEWFPQSGVLLTWPHAATDWQPYLKEVTELYVKLAFRISATERLLIVTPEVESVRNLLRQRLPQEALRNVSFCSCPTNDTWTRDHGPLSVREEGRWMLKDFRFNGWGNKFPSSLDNAITQNISRSGLLNATYSDCLDFTLEGGSIESDGRGTIMTTTHCLLNPNRNAGLERTDIEDRLRRELHARRFLWLHHGELAGDDTDCHIDTLARFCPGNVIAYVQCRNSKDSHYESLKLMEEELRQFLTEKDEPYTLLPLPLPDPVIYDGERLPATYANFLVINDEVLMPSYAQPENDELARTTLQQAFPDHSVTALDCRVLIRQHGSLHCATMQLPKGILPSIQ